MTFIVELATWTRTVRVKTVDVPSFFFLNLGHKSKDDGCPGFFSSAFVLAFPGPRFCALVDAGAPLQTLVGVPEPKLSMP